MRLTATNLACRRGGREVFAGVGFALAAGEALELRGPNGVGKSSLLRLVAGLVPAADGALALEGGAAERTLAEQAHYVGHLDALKSALTVGENLGFWAALLGGSAEAAPSALDTVGLAALAGFPAYTLSAGQRRRLSLARLVAAPRPLWLLDEPTTALDTAGRAMLFDLVGRHLAGGGLAIIATHETLPLPTRRLAFRSAA